MRHLWILTLLLAAVSAYAQQGAPPYNLPPTTPPDFPNQQRPGEAFPPDTRAPGPHEPTDAEAQELVEHQLAIEPLLKHLQLKAKVNEDTIVLSGAVENEQQHKLAIGIAQSYAGKRHIVDKITIRG